MNRKALVLALTVGVSRLAAAQPGPPPDDGTTGTAPVETQPPVHTSPPPPPRSHAVEHMDSNPEDVRPTDLSFAIGIGYAFPDSLETPNTTSVRFRMITGVTFEPRVTLQHTGTTAGTSTTSDTTFLLATAVKAPLIRRGRTDFEGIGSVGLTTHSHDPDGPSNTTTTTALELGWGIGIGYWLGRHWQLSLEATNPLIEYTSTKMQNATGNDTKTSATTVGIVFDPTVLLMIHLYN